MFPGRFIFVSLIACSYLCKLATSYVKFIAAQINCLKFATAQLQVVGHPTNIFARGGVGLLAAGVGMVEDKVAN